MGGLKSDFDGQLGLGQPPKMEEATLGSIGREKRAAHDVEEVAKAVRTLLRVAGVTLATPPTPDVAPAADPLTCTCTPCPVHVSAPRHAWASDGRAKDVVVPEADPEESKARFEAFKALIECQKASKEKG
jgi:hypothetical protein